MTNKLLIYEQQYDVIGFYHIINKEDLEAYTQDWINNYIETANKPGHITYNYVSHETTEDSVNVNLAHGEYVAGGRQYPADKVVVGFNFIELDKMPQWKPEPLTLSK